MNKKDTQTKIFISHSYQDREKAKRIIQHLEQKGFDVFTDHLSIKAGGKIFDKIRYEYETSDFIIVLLSQNLFQSKYFRYEYAQEFFTEAKKRKATIIPVLIERCDIPSDFLAYEIINLSKHFAKGMEKITKKLESIPDISFDEMDHYQFEDLVYDLLKSYGFKNIEQQGVGADSGIDIIAERITTNPFGSKKKETWIVETKFYTQARVDIKAIQQILHYYKYLGKEDAKALIITNSYLTSVVEEYIQYVQKESLIDIEVIDGTQLKQLISRKKRLLNKYFRS